MAYLGKHCLVRSARAHHTRQKDAGTASCIPFTLHLYRLLGYSVLILAALVALVPLSIYQSIAGTSRSQARYVTAGAITLLLAAGVYSTACFPDPARDMVPTLTGREYVSNETDVLNYLRRQPRKGRLLFEYFNDSRKFAWLCQHYMESRLWDDTGFETVNGLFI